MSAWKRAASLLAALLVAVSAASCGSASNVQASATATTEPVTLESFEQAEDLPAGTPVSVPDAELMMDEDGTARLCLVSSDSLPPECIEDEFTLSGVPEDIDLEWEFEDATTRYAIVKLTGTLESPTRIKVDEISNE